MFQNYFKIAFRNLWRNKLYVFINLFGLSVAIACAIVAYLNYDYSYSYDSFHENAGSIYRVIGIRSINQQEVRQGIAPLPLGPILKDEFSSIESMVRMESDRAIVRYRDRVFNESILYCDADFFAMFTFPLKEGSADLNNKSAIAISEEYAIKYFRDENPIGKILTVTYSNGEKKDLTISGVIRKFPKNSSIQFNFVAPYPILEDVGLAEMHNWSHWTGSLFIQVFDQRSIPSIQDHLQRYVAVQNSANLKLPLSGFLIEPLPVVALNARGTRSNMLLPATPPSAIIGSIITAMLMLLMACFNFINTSIAFSARRFKEIGIRKVMGGMRRHLIFQFLSENMLLCFFAMILALGWAELFVPTFNSLMPFVHLSLNYINNLGLILFLFALLLATGILAGLYPAYFISAYQPVAIFRGKQKAGSISFFMRSLLTLQFALSMVAVICSIVFAQNAEFNKNFDFGFARDSVIGIPISSESQFEVFNNAIKNHPAVASISASQNHIHFSGPLRTVRSVDQEREARVLNVGFNYVETMSLKLKEGRSFDEKFLTDQDEAVLINETLMKEMGWTHGVGQTLVIAEKTYQVIGVLEDYYSEGLWRPIRPVVFGMSRPSAFAFIEVRLNAGFTDAGFKFIQTTWEKLFPEIPFDGFFQDVVVAESTQVSEGINRMFQWISGMAIVIAAMGLFALVALSLTRRTKEIGIRKVLGASIANIMALVNKEFIIMLGISVLIADALGYYMVKSLLDSIYAYHVDIEATALIVSNALVFLVAMLTISSQVWKAASENPIHALKYE